MCFWKQILYVVYLKITIRKIGNICLYMNINTKPINNNNK